jgi:elongation factor P--(R)-beta-lysine ligase
LSRSTLEPMSTSPVSLVNAQASKVARLRDRAVMLKEARQFFHERNILEVDCPCLSRFASVDAYIDLVPARYAGRENAYLHSSPEYGMKRLLAQGIGDIGQLSHVFRDGECGFKHNPEFMMAEWYRCGIPFSGMIQETITFIQLFLGHLRSHQISYREVFQRYAGFDYLEMSEEDLIGYLHNHQIAVYPDVVQEGKDALLNLLLGALIEPQLGQEELCVLAYYPSTQAALANTITIGNERVAERFEVYFRGMELSNGYHELTDAAEQRKRLIESNQHRRKLGKDELPIDENFLSALSQGIPDCCGVAVGFDRLMMLRHGASHIRDVVPFAWDEA